MQQRIIAILLLVSTVIISLGVAFLIVLVVGSHNTSIFKNVESLIYLSFIVISLFAVVYLNMHVFQKDLEKKKRQLPFVKICSPLMTLLSIVFALSFIRSEVSVVVLLFIVVTLILPWILLTYQLYFETSIN